MCYNTENTVTVTIVQYNYQYLQLMWSLWIKYSIALRIMCYNTENTVTVPIIITTVPVLTAYVISMNKV